jgi:hydrogenase maturation factor
VTGACDGPVCITCSDQGEPATVLVSDGTEARVELDDGAVRTVDVSLVEPLHRGDGVLLHAGIAIARLAPASATAEEEPA